MKAQDEKSKGNSDKSTEFYCSQLMKNYTGETIEYSGPHRPHNKIIMVKLIGPEFGNTTRMQLQNSIFELLSLSQYYHE